MLCPYCGKQVEENNNFCPYCAKPLQAKYFLDDSVNKAILWQNGEIPVGQAKCYGLSENKEAHLYKLGQLVH